MKAHCQNAQVARDSVTGVHGKKRQCIIRVLENTYLKINLEAPTNKCKWFTTCQNKTEYPNIVRYPFLFFKSFDCFDVKQTMFFPNTKWLFSKLILKRTGLKL